jgi:hypothetical protein
VALRYDDPVKRSALLPVLAAVASAALACAHRPPATPASPPAGAEPAQRPEPEAPTGAPEEPPPPDDPFRVVRSEVDALLRAQGLALWGAWTRGERIDLAKSYSGRERLLSAETVRNVRAAAQRASGDERRALQLLHAFLAGEHLARETGASSERLARARAAATISWDGQQVPAERVPALLAAEPDGARRTALARAYGAATATWAPLADAEVQELDTAARRLGHPSLLALAAEMRGESIEALAALADEVLAATAKPYEAAVGALARAELDVAPDAVRGRDVPRLLRASNDRLFPAARLLADARALFAPLGLDPTQRAGVSIDAEPRPRKDPRPLALPVDVPGDVRLSFVPAPGGPELRALVHELASASYYASVQSPHLEFRRLGGVVVRSWSLLFEEVLGDPAWLLARTGDTEHHLAPVVRAAAARRLHAARDAAVRVLLEARRPRNAADAATFLERAWLRPVGPEEAAVALADRDPLLQSADALRATLFAAQAELLLGRGGAPWWKTPRSGPFIRNAFAEGARHPPGAIVRALGAPGLRAAPLAELAGERLRWAEGR